MLLMVAAIWMMAACGGEPPSLPSQRVATPVPDRYAGYTSPPSDKVQGKLVFADKQFPDAVNPLFAGSTVDFEVGAAPDCSRMATQVEPLPSLVYDPSIQASPYDAGTARKLLKQAGWLPDIQGVLSKDGQPFVIRLVTTVGNPLRIAAAERIQRDLLGVGIEVKVAYYAPGDFFSVYTKGGILATGAYDLAMFGYANGPDPDDEYDVFHSSQIPSANQPGGGNYGGVCDSLVCGCKCDDGKQSDTKCAAECKCSGE